MYFQESLRREKKKNHYGGEEFWEDGRVRKHPESVSPPRQGFHWPDLSDIMIFGILEITEGLQLPEEDLEDKLQFISINFSS